MKVSKTNLRFCCVIHNGTLTIHFYPTTRSKYKPLFNFITDTNENKLVQIQQMVTKIGMLSKLGLQKGQEQE